MVRYSLLVRIFILCFLPVYPGALTCLFSSNHWEHFLCPFVFNKPLGALFIFNIFLHGVISGARSRILETFGVAVLRLAFIANVA